MTVSIDREGLTSVEAHSLEIRLTNHYFGASSTVESQGGLALMDNHTRVYRFAGARDDLEMHLLVVDLDQHE